MIASGKERICVIPNCGGIMTQGRRIQAQEGTEPFREKEQQTHWVCMKCGAKQIAVSLNESMMATTEAERFICPECGHGSPNQFWHDKHMETKHGQDTFVTK